MQSSPTHYLCLESPVLRKFLVFIASLVHLITMQASKQGLHLQAVDGRVVAGEGTQATGMLHQENTDTSPALQKCFLNPTTLAVNNASHVFFRHPQLHHLGELPLKHSLYTLFGAETACTPAL